MNGQMAFRMLQDPPHLFDDEQFRQDSSIPGFEYYGIALNGVAETDEAWAIVRVEYDNQNYYKSIRMLTDKKWSEKTQGW